jgi:hypothetical protein
LAPRATDLNDLERRIKSVLQEETALTTKDLAINGRDLMTELNLAPGPHIGVILAELLETVLDDPEMNSRELLLNIARKYSETRLQQ